MPARKVAPVKLAGPQPNGKDPVTAAFRLEVTKLFTTTPSGRAITGAGPHIHTSAYREGTHLMLCSDAGEHWITHITGDMRFLPSIARHDKRARGVAELDAGDFDEVERDMAAPVARKRAKAADKTPKNKKARPETDGTTPQAPRRQPPRSVKSCVHPPVSLNACHLANVEDDTASCSTATFDNQIQAGLARGAARDASEAREMVREREAERMAVKLEEQDDLASLFGGMDVKSAIELGASLLSPSNH